MYPILFEIPGLGWPIHSFGLMLAIAFLVGMWRLGRYSRQVGIDPQRTSDLSVWIVFSAIIGCRILYFVVHPDQLLVRDGDSVSVWRSFLAFFEVWKGGMVFYGGFLLSIAVGIWKARQYRIPLLKLADITFVCVFLGMFIGRWGCLLVGDDYGKPVSCDAWYALRLPNPLPKGSLFPRDAACLHPTQIYMSLSGLTLFLIGSTIVRRQRAWGITTCTLLMLYAVFRSIIKVFRGDGDARGWVIQDIVSTSQAISIPVFFAGLAGLLWLRGHRGQERVFEVARRDAASGAASAAR